MGYDALLFDNDGVLLERTGDDGRAFEEAVRSAFRDHGVDSPDPDHVRNLVYGEKGLYPDVEVLNDFRRPMGVVSTNQQPTLAFAYDHLQAPSFDVVRGRPMTVESLNRKELGAGSALYVGIPNTTWSPPTTPVSTPRSSGAPTTAIPPSRSRRPTKSTVSGASRRLSGDAGTRS